jgi:hypothetical protein
MGDFSSKAGAARAAPKGSKSTEAAVEVLVVAGDFGRAEAAVEVLVVAGDFGRARHEGTQKTNAGEKKPPSC